MKRRDFLQLTSRVSMGIVGGMLSTKFPLAQTNDRFDTKILVSNSLNHQTAFKAQKTNWKIINRLPTNIWGFQKQQFGIPIVAKQNEIIKIPLTNTLTKETLGLHWHGIRLPNPMDGVPKLTQKPIGHRETFNYQFSSPDSGTYWYHTHSHSLEQLRRGLMGPLVIKEEKEYPVDEDMIIFANDWILDKNMKMTTTANSFTSRHFTAHEGMLGNVVTVNGRVNPTYAFRPNSRVRFRVICGSTARLFYINFPASIHPHLITVDGQAVDVEKYQKIVLAPGMRIDIVADISTLNRPLQIVDESYSLKENLFRIVTSGKPIRKKILTEQPPRVKDNPIPKPNLNQAEIHRVVLGGGAMSGMMGMMRGMASGLFWTINNTQMSEEEDYVKPILQLKQGKTYLFRLENQTRFFHPIHMHGHSFFILSRNGRKEKKPRPTDTVFMEADETAEIAFVADNPGKWMFHCHLIDHQISGMVSFIEVG